MELLFYFTQTFKLTVRRELTYTLVVNVKNLR